MTIALWKGYGHVQLPLFGQSKPEPHPVLFFRWVFRCSGVRKRQRASFAASRLLSQTTGCVFFVKSLPSNSSKTIINGCTPSYLLPT